MDNGTHYANTKITLGN